MTSTSMLAEGAVDVLSVRFGEEGSVLLRTDGVTTLPVAVPADAFPGADLADAAGEAPLAVALAAVPVASALTAVALP